MCGRAWTLWLDASQLQRQTAKITLVDRGSRLVAHVGNDRR